MESRSKLCKSHWSVKYRSPGQGTCCQNIIEKHYARYGGCRPNSWEVIEHERKMSNIGQGHQVKVPVNPVQWGEALCKV